MTNIIIDDDFSSVAPPLRSEELSGLEASLKTEGCRDPLVVWGSQRILLDGHNRYRICKQEGIRFETVTREFPDRDSAKVWVIENQLHRRNLPDIDRIALATKKEHIIAARAKENQGTRTDIPKKSSECLFDPIETREKAAADAGVSHDTYAKGKAVLASGAPELVQAVREKKTTINAAVAIATKPAQEQREIVARGKKEILKVAKEIKKEKLKQQREEREQKRLADLEAKAEIAKSNSNGKYDQWSIIEGDCVELLAEHECDDPRCIGEAKARLIFADPPYNIGVDYGDHYNDSRSWEDYEEWSRSWITAAVEKLTWDGSLWLLIGWEWAHDLAVLGRDIGLHIRQTLVWYETFGVNTTRMFNRCSRALIWFTHHPETFVFRDHELEIRRPSDRQTKYNDERANPDGKLWDDVWGINPPIPRVTGTSSERIPGFPTQLPLALLRPIIACATEPGDLVIDPFCGSGTTGAVCLEMGRKFMGIELSYEFAKLARKRLMAMGAAS